MVASSTPVTPSRRAGSPSRVRTSDRSLSAGAIACCTRVIYSRIGMCIPPHLRRSLRLHVCRMSCGDLNHMAYLPRTALIRNTVHSFWKHVGRDIRQGSGSSSQLS